MAAIRKPRRLNAVDSEPARAVLYVRVSALMGRKGDDFHSPDLQLAAMRRNVAPAGLREVAVVQDLDVSGRTFSREGLDEIRRMVEAKQVEVIAVYDYSRLGRNVAEASAFIRWLGEKGVRVVSANERVDDSPEGNFMVNQFLGMAQLYSDQMAQRWTDVIVRRVTEQGLPHGNVPTGYLRVEGRYIIDPVLGPAITEAFRLYATGAGLGEIRKVIGAARGNRFPRQAVRRVLNNQVYLGQVHLGDTWYPGQHEPLTDEQTWDRVRKRSAIESKLPPKTIAGTYSLTGLMFCAFCGRRLVVWPDHHRGTMIHRVMCRQKTEGITFCPGIGTPQMTRIETEVLDQLELKIGSLKSDADRFNARAVDTSISAAAAARLEQQLTKTINAMARLMTDRALDGDMPEAAYSQAMSQLRKQEADLSEQLAEAKLVAVPRQSPVEFAEIARRIIDLWPRLKADERNRALRPVISGIIIRRGIWQREPTPDRVWTVFAVD